MARNIEIEAGLARWVSREHNRGWVLTAKGRTANEFLKGDT